jgi:molybdenum cofactor cytidylyltransferase
MKGSGILDLGMATKIRSNSRVGAVVLAAGSSSRMGEAKQLLPLADSTVLGQTLGNLLAAKVDEIVLVLGSSAETIRQQIAELPMKHLKILVNPEYGQGMATSLRAGLAALDEDIEAALIVLADQPFIRTETFDRIMDEYRRSVAQIVIPMFQGFRGNPVLLDRSVFLEVMALRGDIGCRAIFGNHLDGIIKSEVNDIGILLDIDNKDDYERLRDFGQPGQEERLLVEATREAREMPGSGEQVFTSAAELIIVGWNPAAVALAKLGAFLKFMVTVVDPLIKNSDLPVGSRSLNTLDLSRLSDSTDKYVVVASRGQFDEEAIEQALRIDSAYVGLLANRERGREMLRRLESQGELAEKLTTVRVPAGLEIGASTAEEIAISIMAEIISQKAGKDATTKS